MASTEVPKSETLEPPPAGVPRQFTVGTLLLITLIYAVLFATLKCFKAPFEVFLFMTVFTTFIGLGQALLYGGKKPVLASVTVGFVLTFGISILAQIADSELGLKDGDIGRFIFGLGGATYVGVFGAVGGLIIGRIIGIIFYFSWWVREGRARTGTEAESAGRNSPFDDDDREV